MDDLRNMVLAMIKNALLGFDDMLVNADNVLTSGLDAWGPVTGVSNALVPFCMIIIGITLLIELAQVAAKVDIIRWEHGLKICVKVALTRVFIDIAPTFLEACYMQANQWIGNVTFTGNNNLGALVNNDMDTLVNAITGLWSILGLLITTLILVLAIKACGLIVAVIAFGRMFEMYVYLAISPLPCAFFPLGSGDGGGFSRITAKFLRGFAAVALQGVMMIVCIRIFGLVMSTEITRQISLASTLNGAVAVSELCYTLLLGGVVLVMSVVKCGSWAKSILDAM